MGGKFKADVNREKLQFFYRYSESDKEVGPVFDMKLLSDENSGGFTGEYVGLCCNDPATRIKYAEFEFFEYI